MTTPLLRTDLKDAKHTSLKPILFSFEYSASFRWVSCKNTTSALAFFNLDKIFPLLTGLSTPLTLKEAIFILYSQFIKY